MQAEAEKAQRMVMDMSQQRSASEASLTAAHQAITEAAARERELVEQLQKADEVHSFEACQSPMSLHGRLSYSRDRGEKKPL